MRITTTLLAACLCAALVNSLPFSGQGLRSQALDRLMVVEADNDSPQRNKRTIGILRQLFPEVSKMIEDKVNAVIGEIFKIFGPVVFQSLLGRNKPGGNGGGGGGLAAGGSAKSSGTTVEAKNPFGDEDEDDDWFKSKEDNETGSKISLDFPPESIDQDSKGGSSSTTAKPASSSTSSENIDTITLDTTPANAENNTSNASVNPEAVENQVVSEADSQPSQSQPQPQQQVIREQRSPAAAESQQNEVKVSFADEVAPSNAEGDLTPLEDIEASDDDSRNKRFLNFGGAGGGSGGGSGNFLFDIIRQAADSAARAAGTVYRVVAGTQSLGLGLSASRDLGPIPSPMMPAASGGPAAMMPAPGNGTAMMPPLVAGSGSGSSSGGGDAAANGEARAPEPGPQQEAVPGPVTRLFVIANRGISNLIQDLILRLAATSERIVNFKARLITSII